MPNCDATFETIKGKPDAGPCVLEEDHYGPVHRDAQGRAWGDPELYQRDLMRHHDVG